MITCWQAFSFTNTFHSNLHKHRKYMYCSDLLFPVSIRWQKTFFGNIFNSSNFGAKMHNNFLLSPYDLTRQQVEARQLPHLLNCDWDNRFTSGSSQLNLAEYVVYCVAGKESHLSLSSQFPSSQIPMCRFNYSKLIINI